MYSPGGAGGSERDMVNGGGSLTLLPAGLFLAIAEFGWNELFKFCRQLGQRLFFFDGLKGHFSLKDRVMPVYCLLLPYILSHEDGPKCMYESAADVKRS